MRTIWTIISMLALANLLAVAGFIGWLGMSDRLSEGRIERVRAVFAPTNAQEKSDNATADAEAKRAASEAQEAARVGGMPMPSVDRTRTLEELEAIANMRVARAEGEVKRMREALELSWEELRRERARFEETRSAFETMRAELQATEGSEQFRKAVALYESVGTESATNMLRQIMEGSRPRNESLRTVAGYLNAMKPRNAAQIIKQFEASDPALAADLLERIRSLGVDAAAPEGPDANARSNAPAALPPAG